MNKSDLGDLKQFPIEEDKLEDECDDDDDDNDDDNETKQVHKDSLIIKSNTNI